MEKVNRGSRPQNTIAVRKLRHVFQKVWSEPAVDPHVLDKIVAAAGIGPDDFVVEIGPGIGTLTQYLAYAAWVCVRWEIDKNLIDLSGGYAVVMIVLGLSAMMFEGGSGGAGGRRTTDGAIKVVANLP